MHAWEEEKRFPTISNNWIYKSRYKVDVENINMSYLFSLLDHEAVEF